MKKVIVVLMAMMSAFGMFAYALSVEKELQVQTATEKIMDYLLVQPREVANNILLVLKSYQKDFLVSGETDKLAIVTMLLEQLTPFVTCVYAEGTWLVEARECEFIGEETCRSMGGVFDACASACRHGGSTICTLQCVPVCSMQTESIAPVADKTMRITVGPAQNTCYNMYNVQTSCFLVRPQGQIGWTLMQESIQGFDRDAGFTYELEVLVTNDGRYHYLNTISKTIDLSVCNSYFDGCNTCTVTDGKIAACTRKYCENPVEPRCIDIITE